MVQSTETDSGEAEFLAHVRCNMFSIADGIATNKKEPLEHTQHWPSVPTLKAFQQEFKDCTMLVVAHRLQTVMNADVIAVLDAGRVVEAGAKDWGLTYWGSSQFLQGSQI